MGGGGGKNENKEVSSSLFTFDILFTVGINNLQLCQYNRDNEASLIATCKVPHWQEYIKAHGGGLPVDSICISNVECHLLQCLYTARGKAQGQHMCSSYTLTHCLMS